MTQYKKEYKTVRIDDLSFTILDIYCSVTKQNKVDVLRELIANHCYKEIEIIKKSLNKI